MKVKIGNTIYDSNEVPIMVILSDEEKSLIGDMADDNFKFCSFPESMPKEKIIAFMDDTAMKEEVKERLFPIMSKERNDHIPWSALEAHREQAMQNHGQTLEILAHRGGLAWSEALAILEDRRWKNNMNEAEAKIKVLQILSIKCINCGVPFIWGKFAYNQNTCWDCFKKEVQVMRDSLGWYPSWLWNKREAHQEILDHMLGYMSETIKE